MHCLEVIGGTTSKENVVKCGFGSLERVAKGSRAAGRASYLPSPWSGITAVGVSV